MPIAIIRTGINMLIGGSKFQRNYSMSLLVMFYSVVLDRNLIIFTSYYGLSTQWSWSSGKGLTVVSTALGSIDHPDILNGKKTRIR